MGCLQIPGHNPENPLSSDFRHAPCPAIVPVLTSGILAATPLAQAVLDATGRITWANPRWLVQMGSGTNWLELVDAGKFAGEWSALGRLQAGELQEHRATVPVGAVATPLIFTPLPSESAGEQALDVLVTALPGNTVGALDPVSAIEDCRHLAGALSHDVRQHARLASVYCSLINRGDLDERQRGMLAVVADHADRMQHVLGILVRWLRLAEQPVDRRPCDLGRLWSRATANLAAECLGNDLPAIVGDPELLEEMLRELAVNAVRFHGARPQISLRAELQEDYWELHIDDDGPGIPPQHWERVLQPLHRLHSWEEVKGHGMGLAVAERIAVRHGGSLRIVSKSGAGCSVQVRLRV